jgi:hypothetical protein
MHIYIPCVIYFEVTFVCGVHAALHAEFSPENYPNWKTGNPVAADHPPKILVIR